MSTRAPRILFVPLEFPQWKDASHWGYAANMGMEPGLIANGVEYFILPATHRYSGKKRFWVDFARSLLAGRQFDQIWFEAVHSSIDDDILEFLCSLSPVRIGFCFESLQMADGEWKNNPEGCRVRQESIDKRLSVMTHLLTTDELDAARLNRNGTKPVRAMPPGYVIPREFIGALPPPSSDRYALFYGALYGERRAWIEHPLLSAKLRYSNSSPEVTTEFPSMFDRLHQQASEFLDRGIATADTLQAYLYALRVVRRNCFLLWLDGLRLGAAVVNLPQLGRAYASRIIEGMAAGRPVIAEEMEDRPLAKSAFEDGKEILLYRTPEQLAAQLERVINDPAFGQMIASNAQKKLIASHTTEQFVKELLEWAR